MKETHIIEALDNSPLAGLGESELRSMLAHVQSCAPCRRAYEASRLSTLLIEERAAQTIEPSPFFQTRVLATWREQQANNSVSALSRWWRSAGALVSSLALTTAALAAFSFLAPAVGSSTAPE